MYNKKKMSKVLFTSFMSLSVLLAGCGAQDNSAKSNVSKNETQTAQSDSGLKGDLHIGQAILKQNLKLKC